MDSGEFLILTENVSLNVFIKNSVVTITRIKIGCRNSRAPFLII